MSSPFEFKIKNETCWNYFNIIPKMNDIEYEETYKVMRDFVIESSAVT
jgi:hypothetical protein